MRLTLRAIRAAAMSRVAAAALLLAVLSGCSAEAPGTGATASGVGATHVPGSAAQVERKVGSAIVHVYAMQTSSIPEAVAREHGIERSPELIMLRVSGRSTDADAAGVPLEVDVRVGDLQGKTQALPVKEVVVNGLTDYVATTTASLPDTLRFDVRVTTPEGITETLQLTRDFDRP